MSNKRRKLKDCPQCGTRLMERLVKRHRATIRQMVCQNRRAHNGQTYIVAS